MERTPPSAPDLSDDRPFRMAPGPLEDESEYPETLASLNAFSRPSFSSRSLMRVAVLVLPLPVLLWALVRILS